MKVWTVTYTATGYGTLDVVAADEAAARASARNFLSITIPGREITVTDVRLADSPLNSL